MRRVITYGTYDLLHYGHIALLERAKKLGDYLIVGVTSDAFDKNRGKLNVQQSLVERIEAVKATGLADEIIVEEYEGQKISDIQKYGVDIFAIGSDWQGKFDYLNEYCQVVYLKRTEGISSTELRATKNPAIKIGAIGTDNPIERVIEESLFVSGIEFTGIYGKDKNRVNIISDRFELKIFDELTELLDEVDAVYISEIITEHAAVIQKALEKGCHVLCESPMLASLADAKRLFEMAKMQNLVLFEAIKTLFFPAFEHLMLIVNSGLIGTVRDIEISCSQIPENFEDISKIRYKGSMYDWGSIVVSPIIKLLGTEYDSCILYDYEKNNYNYLVRGILQYKSATAVFKAGKGIKTEGHMVITGTEGYIYIPAPWWKTDYFEIRYEDLRATKKYFFKYEGEGFRYELLEFVKMINQNSRESYQYSQKEMLSVIRIIEQFDKQDVQKILGE